MGISPIYLIVGGALFGLSLLGGADHDLGGHSVGGYGLATDHHSAGDALHPGDAVIVIGQQGGVLDVKLWDGA